MQATASLCRPAVQAGSRYDTPFCRKLMDFVFNDFLVHNQVIKILLAASWKDEDLPFLSTTLGILKSRGYDVTVLGPIVEYDAALPRLLADEILHDNPVLAAAMRKPGILQRDRAIRRIAADHGVAYVSVYDSVCRENRCDTFAAADVPLQFDAGHLTAQGSLEVGRRLSPLFLGKVARADNVLR